MNKNRYSSHRCNSQCSILTSEYLLEQYVDLQKHIKTIAEENNLSLHIVRAHLSKFNIPTRNGQSHRCGACSVLTQEYLEQHYVKEHKSVLDINLETNIPIGAINLHLQRYGLRRSCKEASNTLAYREKVTKTNLARYGSPHNFCRDAPSRKSWQQRLLTEEGITNVFQRPEVKDKIRDTLLTKYGTELSNVKLTSRGKVSFSKIHREVVEELRELNIDCLIEKKIPKSNGMYWAFDILIEPDLLIEVNGDYWHGNPNIYLPTDIILKGSSREIVVSDKWKWDAEKHLAAKNLGFRVLVIWESDLKLDKRKQIQRVIDAIGKNQINQESE